MAKAQLTIDFWDVGQADCSVIELPNGSLVIIDVGRKTSPLIEYLQRQGNRIEAIVLTHNHADHAGAMPSIVHQFKDRIGTVFMLKDVDKSDETFQKIFRPVAEGFAAGFFDVQQLDKGRTIVEDSTIGVRIEAVFPHFVASQQATTDRNLLSAIVRLDLRGETKVVWGSDNSLRRLAEMCASFRPMQLVGPHHGGPKDGNEFDVPAWINTVGPQRAFISVGSHNSHSHPKSFYLQSLRSQGCKVVCSQITKRCDVDATARGRPIFPSHGLLGLPAPRSGTSCRGPVRLELRNNVLEVDPWDREHLSRISKLKHPQCLPPKRTAAPVPGLKRTTFRGAKRR